MGQLLDTLGSGYRYTEISYDDLLDGDKLAAYDVVFLTCSGTPPAWLGRRLAPTAIAAARASSASKSRSWTSSTKSLRQYVRQGGTLYASDWQFELVKIAFPEYVDESRGGRRRRKTSAPRCSTRYLQRRLGPRWN